MNLRETIKATLAASGISQQAVADRASVPQPNISAYLRGRADFNGETIDRILAALDLTVTQKEKNPGTP